MKIWMLGGKIHSGKNLAAKMAKEWLESQGLKVDCEMLAKGVKDGCKRDFAVLANYMNELSAEAKRNGDDFLADLLRIKDENWYEDKTALTRILLQIYGTEIFRKNVSESWWTEQLVKRVKENPVDVVLVTDFRFPSEYQDLKKAFPDTTTLRIWRGNKEGFVDTNTSTQAHDSETALDHFVFDHEIDNNGTVEELEAKVKEIFSSCLP